MSDPVLALVLIAAFFVVITAASYFRTLESGIWIEARLPLITGAICGLIIHVARFVPSFVATGIILTIAALYVRLMGRESEPADGMILGAIVGAAASIPLVIFAGEHELLRFAECVLAGAVAGYGITFGLTHVRDKGRQALVDAATAAIAIGVASLPALLVRGWRMNDRQIAIGAAGLVPLLVVITVFKQWPSIRAELRHEAALGFMDDDDVRATAHPLLRLGRAGWHDAEAHRAFVRMASKIALRKRQQRNRAEEIARLYQLEVIKLRMQMQEMSSIDRRMRAGLHATMTHE
ncbi:MAG TPA: hypothetical protein VGQ76_21465 [Thermoanaerobaculia bacterium]|jgi:hypothetical protein|nr:hypothetical protein [Thermoanaerobaculia bacterium]